MSHEIVERALALSKADSAVVIATESSTVNLRWANNTLTTNGSSLDKSIVVISIIGKAFGVRSASVVNGDSLEALIRDSEEDARSASDADDFNHLIDGDVDADFDKPAESCSTRVFNNFVQELSDAFANSRREQRRLFGFATYDLTTTWLGTSNGTRKRFVEPTGYVDWTAKNESPRGSAWHGESTRDFCDVSALATEQLLKTRLGWSERTIDLPAGRYETLLPPSAVADLFLYAHWSSSGRDAADGRNAFAEPGGGTRIGERISINGFNMYSDPFDKALPTRPFVAEASSSSETSIFDNGLALGRTDWIKDGVLTALIETRSSARDRKVAVTPDVNNLIIDAGGTKSLDEMVASTERGLLLTCLWYIREIDPQRLAMTGLTRDGVFLIENGEVQGAVNNFRWNESPVELLGRISEVGQSIQTLPREWNDYFTLTRMPPIRIPDFNMSTVSPAN